MKAEKNTKFHRKMAAIKGLARVRSSHRKKGQKVSKASKEKFNHLEGLLKSNMRFSGKDLQDIYAQIRKLGD